MNPNRVIDTSVYEIYVSNSKVPVVNLEKEKGRVRQKQEGGVKEEQEENGEEEKHKLKKIVIMKKKQ